LQTANEFVEEVLLAQLKMKSVLVGTNFAFGQGRSGNVALLNDLGSEKDFSVEPIQLLTNESESPVSSTLIRQYISVGNVSKAKQLLTRPHELSGVVVHGDKLGTDLGYPTANTEVEEKMAVPSDGVYSGKAVLEDGRKFLSAISIGVRPMFHEDNIRVIEPHLLDFSGDIYGQKITIQFEDKIRDQLVLDSKEALIKQIDQDILQVRNSLEIN
jgi:riboflavin kinase/FMN adenylyltransferase